ncbi:TPA: hypothetical protein ACGUO4_000292 [Yersinia enterocolitica]|nr:hypothetical protein [Yersinia enterocolitica]
MNIVAAKRSSLQLRCLPVTGRESFRYVMRIPGLWVCVTHSTADYVVDTFRYLALPAPKAGQA